MNALPERLVRAAEHESLRIFGQVLAEPGRYMRPWYFAYLLLGIVTAGMVPVLLPLMMMAVSHRLSAVAYVMGVYDLGLLTSIVWGVLAERRHWYRRLFFSGFLLSVLAVAVFLFMRTLGGWMACAFVLGAGSSAAATIASLLIVDFEPSKEWEPRIGLLQSFNGAGQVVGLLLAGVFSRSSFSEGLWLAAILLVPALVFARLGLPAATRRRRARAEGRHPHRLLDVRALAAFPHVDLPAGIAFHFHLFNLHGLRRLPTVLGTPFGRFLLSWFMLALGVAAFFTYFPVMLADSYGMSSHFSSLIYAVVAAVGIVLFVLASRWSARLGSQRVYQFGLWVRFLGFVLLLLPFIVPLRQRFAFAALGFALIVAAWPVLSVAGTDLAARLAPFSEGAAMGLFNSALSFATVIGAFASGPLVAHFGYSAVAEMALAGIAMSVLLGLGLKPGAPRSTPAAARDSST